MKKLYMTTGTHEYLAKIMNEHPEEKMILMRESSALLVHETDGESVFESPRSYEVIDEAGALERTGYAIFNNIPVTDEGRPLFEYRFKNRARLIEEVPGFSAIRVLRPLDSDTYVIMTIWEDRKSFLGWQESKQYEKAHAKRGTEEGIDSKKEIFPRASYVTEYEIVSG
ncbi:antibiotic biosynthesis monooxygenase [Rossellomorea aquimaris]|uniref:antibiotic biosynthesis monooxygenase family protein n=1 Tax=Rossellomorea aquimaris TaxID=189382 RepID=UPI001CD45A3C|nr:antibiotic biosynthesis monooxygenase [Rossellomorea aquimaris]MCA1056460.1 antibiotic biosynthesis monooxygenase [Rossellomorea aquimaris]